jgi:hypothetical protein
LADPGFQRQWRLSEGLFMACGFIILSTVENYIGLTRHWIEASALLYGLEREFWTTQILFAVPGLLTFILFILLAFRKPLNRTFLISLTALHLISLLHWATGQILRSSPIYTLFPGPGSFAFLIFSFPLLRKGRELNEFNLVRKSNFAWLALFLSLLLVPRLIFFHFLNEYPLILVTNSDSCISAFGKYIH